jgi:hypothetical protein
MDKKRRVFEVCLVGLLLVGLAYPLTIAHATSYEGTATLNCEGWVANDGSVFLTRDNTGRIGRFEGPLERYQIVGWDGGGTQIYFQEAEAELGEKVNGIGNFTPWMVAPQYNPLTFQFISLAGNGLPEVLVFEATGICPGLPYNDVPVTGDITEPQPGCDTLLAIPSTAVVGLFVADAPVYWEPGKSTHPLVTIKAGNTAWVIQLDGSGRYYEIIWSCDYVWVPALTLAPNPDQVWKSRPLPGGPVPLDGSSSGQSNPRMGSIVPAFFPVYGAPVDAETYTVQAGDNLFRIASHFGVDLYQLAAVNGILDPGHILVGQVLDIAAAR